MFQIMLGKINIGKKGVKKGLRDEKEVEAHDDREDRVCRGNDTKVKYT